MSVQHAGRVVISTHDLQRAGQLRAAFRDGALDGRQDTGFRVARYLYGAQ